MSVEKFSDQPNKYSTENSDVWSFSWFGWVGQIKNFSAPICNKRDEDS